MTTPEMEKELERLAKTLGGGWKIEMVAGLPIPKLTLVMMEAQNLERRLKEAEARP